MSSRLRAPLLLALVLALSSACGDALEGESAGDRGREQTGGAAELRAQLAELDARLAALEARMGAIAAALSADGLGDIGEELALLAERVRELSADPALASVDAIDPLFCLDPAHPGYPSAQFDVYVRGIPICGIVP